MRFGISLAMVAILVCFAIASTYPEPSDAEFACAILFGALATLSIINVFLAGVEDISPASAADSAEAVDMKNGVGKAVS